MRVTYLWCHEGNRSQQLALKLPGARRLGRQPGSRPEVTDSQVLARAVDQQVSTYTGQTMEKNTLMMADTGCFQQDFLLYNAHITDILNLIYD